MAWCRGRYRLVVVAVVVLGISVVSLVQEHRFSSILSMLLLTDDDLQSAPRSKQSNHTTAQWPAIPDRIFDSRSTLLPLCVPPAHDPPWTNKRALRRPAADGLFFLKLLKTASSTGASVHLRMATQLARRKQNVLPDNHPNRGDDNETLSTSTLDDTVFSICKTRHLHGFAGPRQYRFGERHRSQSVLWTLVREPVNRLVREFFHFQVSRNNVNATEEALHAHLLETMQKGEPPHYLSWLDTSNTTTSTATNETMKQRIATATHILQDYDFVGITERFDESIVCLAMLWNLKLSDILYVSSKTNGGYDGGGYRNQCYYIPPTDPDVTHSASVEALLKSRAWREYIYPDVALYEAASRSLDRTIDALGRDEFETNLARFREAQQRVQQKCTKVKFPCTKNGQKRKPEETDCLSGDLGCGFDCLDQVAAELDLW